MIRKFVLFVVSGSLCFGQQVSGGAVTGLVKGEDGTTIVGANVNLHFLPPYPRGKLRATEWFSTSRADGSFRFDVPYYGLYRLCAQVQSSTWLNPCEWGVQAPVTSLSVAQRSAGVTIVLKKGVAVPIRVDDPGRWLSQNDGKTSGSHLLLGVATDALTFHPAPEISKDSLGRDHQIIIPFNTPVKLVVNSAFFKLTDGVGQPVGRSGTATIPIIVPSGRQPAPVKLVVVGGGR